MSGYKQQGILRHTRIIGFIGMLSLLLIGCTPSKTEVELKLIPKPEKVEVYSEQKVEITTPLKVFEKPQGDNNSNIEYLAEYIGKILPVEVDWAEYENANIMIEYVEKEESDESYILEIKGGKISLSGGGTGVFRGIQTLAQLLYQYYDPDTKQVILPSMKIEDAPKFIYRGMHLDVSRHFFGVEDIKKMIDMMAKLKLNNFHWHLTDDQGWRIEIKKYPRLTTIGSKRAETIVRKNFNPYVGDNTPVEGFYTQDEIREVVEFAESRKINIIPEIEMPGHASAALAAYPHLGCSKRNYKTATKWGIFKEVFCAGNEETFVFLKDVLDEVLALFPSKLVHIGGDEVLTNEWEHCGKCQKIMDKEGFKDIHKLQDYFIAKIETYLESKGRRMIGWDEILNDDLSENSIIMYWRSRNVIDSLKQDVIMSPTNYCYFDYYQSTNKNEPLAIGGFISLQDVYEYAPTHPSSDISFKENIIGIQANVWTEYMKSFSHVEYMVFPRLFALAEVAWVKDEVKDFDNFTQRLYPQLEILEQLDVNYSKALFETHFKVKPSKEGEIKIKLSTYDKNHEIKYVIEKEGVKGEYVDYKNPVTIKENCSITAQSFLNGEALGEPISNEYVIHKGVGVKAELLSNPSPKYAPASSSFALVNGVFGSPSYNNNEWFGMNGENFEAILEFENETEISSVGVNYLVFTAAWIFPPKNITFWHSKDGVDYELLHEKNNVEISTDGIEKVRISIEKTKVKFLKVRAENNGIIAEGYPGEGHKAWLFIDEIVLN